MIDDWYRDAIIYELHVRAFRDANGDGIGDVRGLTESLDYLQDLGVTALWLLPFYPSPLRDDGYDIADYRGINADYGSMRQFKAFVRKAHDRGLKVITELVVNHTSDQHPWFQRAVASPPGSRYRDWYVWSDTPDRYRDVRIIFQDFETSNWSWHPQAQQYYWHRFYAHQPDLNFDNPEVQQAVKEVLDHWAEMGVDGMRLDAIPYLFEREDLGGENLPETHEFLRDLRKHLDANHPGRMLLAEANQWPEDAAAYFGGGDECHMCFHFPLMPRLFMAVSQEDRYPIVDILQQTPAIEATCQWALFLRNHDELTLEMVTDEERDFMYRAYAHDPRMRINLGIRRRLAPLLGNDRRLIELMNSLLMAMPGTPVLYYGDEIGMGDNVFLGDRNGVRTPMQWSSDRNAGFSRANPQQLYLPVVIDPEYHYQSVNVEAQHNNPRSLLWWMKRLIALRKRTAAFGRGSLDFLYPDNAKTLAFLREHEDERVLIVANLSRHAQVCELDLSAYAGLQPVEMFGRTPFPPVTDQAYVLTLGAYQFYWFLLESTRDAISAVPPEAAAVEVDPAVALPSVTAVGEWTSLLRGRGRERLEAVLPDVLRRRRWFGGKARELRFVRVTDVAAVGARTELSLHLLVVRVEYVDGEPEDYLMTVAFAAGEAAGRLRATAPETVLVEVSGTGRERDVSGVIYEALHDSDASNTLLALVARSRRTGSDGGELIGRRGAGFGRARDAEQLDAALLRGEQSNSAVVFGDRYLMKVLRRLEPGTNPDVEVGGFLTRQGFQHIPELLGSLEYRPAGAAPRTMATVQRYVQSEGDAWSLTRDEIGRFAERIMAAPPGGVGPDTGASTSLVGLASEPVPEAVYEVIGPYVDAVELLGQRTAEMHAALAGSGDDHAFAPQPFTTLYQRSLYQSLRNQARRGLHAAARDARQLPDDTRAAVRELARREPEILERMHALAAPRLGGARIRTHGDYHLGQVLFTGRDFVIIDFEGEPTRPLGERRIKRSALRDVAGMLRSFHYAVFSALDELEGRGEVSEAGPSREALLAWLDFWHRWVTAGYLRGYLEHARGHVFVPADRDQVRRLLDAFLLEKAIYELGYEMNNRPAWAHIPLTGVVAVLDAPL